MIIDGIDDVTDGDAVLMEENYTLVKKNCNVIKVFSYLEKINH